VNGVVMSVDDYFRHVSHEGLEERLIHLYPDEAKRDG
jgi:DNA polymerase III subunit alpha